MTFSPKPWGVWYMYLKTKNCYLKIYVKIHMDEKMCKKT